MDTVKIADLFELEQRTGEPIEYCPFTCLKFAVCTPKQRCKGKTTKAASKNFNRAFAGFMPSLGLSPSIFLRTSNPNSPYRPIFIVSFESAAEKQNPK